MGAYGKGKNAEINEGHKMKLNKEVAQLFADQLSVWEQAKGNYDALSHIKVKEEPVNGVPFKVQFNPARIVSSAAKVDPKSIKERKCFLCAANRPSVQKGIDFKGEAATYEILLNPFPIFPKHLTLPDKIHTRQQISGRYADMLELAYTIDDFVLFYNGPKCGASAPDHMHFQAGNKGFLPLEKLLCNAEGAVNEELVGKQHKMNNFKGGELYTIEHIVPGTLLFTGKDKSGMVAEFEKICSFIPVKEGEWEPMMNVITWFGHNAWFTLLFIRGKHRPACYFAEGEENMLLSPASVDLGGVFITPLEKDFGRLNGAMVESVLKEIAVESKFMGEIDDKLKQL